MKIRDIYTIAVAEGIKKDPRPKGKIQKLLEGEKRIFRKLKGIEKRCYDTERLKNPYADTRILYGDSGKDIKTVMVGIDMESPELLLADRLNERGACIDLVMAHHPEGGAWAGFYDVMRMQALILNKFGISLKIAEDLLKERLNEVKRAVSPANHYRSVDAARLLNIPYMCVHTPADNHVVDHLQRLFDAKRPKKLSQVVAILNTIPEYKDATAKNAGPRILIGELNNTAGKVFVDMTGGTEGPKRVFSRLSQAGVGTIIAMHLDEEHFKNAKDEHINVVIAGHIASDTLGLNLLFDTLERKEALRVIPCSGFIRVKRN